MPNSNSHQRRLLPFVGERRLAQYDFKHPAFIDEMEALIFVLPNECQQKLLGVRVTATTLKGYGGLIADHRIFVDLNFFEDLSEDLKPAFITDLVTQYVLSPEGPTKYTSAIREYILAKMSGNIRQIRERGAQLLRNRKTTGRDESEMLN